MTGLSAGFRDAYDPARGLPHSPEPDVLADLGDRRLRDMDVAGIDLQVLF